MRQTTLDGSPKTGVVQANSLDEWFFEDLFANGIDLSYNSFIQDLEEQGLSEEEIEQETDFYQSDCSTWLLGDWKQDVNGMWEIDKQGKLGYALSFNSGSNTVCVDYSNVTTLCHNTSPCYVMSDNSGPCGDLDTAGTNILAYDLPKDFYREGL